MSPLVVLLVLVLAVLSAAGLWYWSGRPVGRHRAGACPAVERRSPAPALPDLPASHVRTVRGPWAPAVRIEGGSMPDDYDPPSGALT